ncbi:copper resistance CopC/CopD family protein [Streptomyces aurantiogriseus]|uniref:Transport integral membrane protein n=1 Tax=Streptomyces aurantiogriseus TaxID=66870 RepID=A0A918C853_9ACTN|nr:copper resistance protein CopC [Streptomyces aurantiogriseus]GGR10560.1 transport integral membrane protein [Streptomyces aurantiogriseus]
MSTFAASRPGRRAGALVLLLGAVLGLLFAGAGPAAAHAKVRDTNPAEGSVLKTAPSEVTMTFTESMTLFEDSIKVLDPDGRRIEAGTTEHVGSDPATARVALPAGLADGTYTVSWKAVSADSHPIGEAFVFSVGAPSPTRAVVSDTQPGEGLVGTLYSGARFVAYLGYVLMVGTAAFLLVCWPDGARLRRMRRLLVAGWVTLLLSGLTLLTLRAPYTSGESLAEAVDPAALRDTLGTEPGSALMVRLLVLAASGLFLAGVAGAAKDAADAGSSPGRRRPALIAAGALIASALAYTWALTGHAAAGEQTRLAIPADALHLVTVALWLGGLVALVIVLFRAREGEEAPPEAVARFSRLAFVSVVVLAATGLYQSWRLVGSWDALTSSRFGTLLLLKTAAVAAVLLVAAYSRRWTARLREPAEETAAGEAREPALAVAAARGSAQGGADSPQGEASPTDTPELGTASGDTGPADPDPRHRLRRSVAAEALLAVAVLGITTVLTETTPARTEANAATVAAVTVPAQPNAVSVTVPFDTGAENGSGNVLITLSPASVGRNELQALVYAVDGGIISIPELRITFTSADGGIGPLDANLRNVGGYWQTGNLQLSKAGKWTMAVTVRVTDIDQTTTTKSITIS